MKKLTAGIFAGILTIVTVNAADAAIASKAYVDQQRDVVKALTETNKTDIAGLTQTVGEHTTSISGLQETVGNLTGGGADSVAGKIASALGGTYSGENTVKAALELKADKATVGTPDSGKTVVQMIKDVQTAAGTDVADKLGGTFSKDSTVQDALDLKADKAQLGNGFTADNTVEKAINNITAKNTGLIDTKISAAVNEINTTTGGLETRLTTAEGKITTNTNAITTLNGDGEGSVKKQIKDAIAGVDTKLADKQDLLNGTNVSTKGEGNVVSSVSAVDGVVTATKGINAVTVPTSNTPSESGTYVLTATVAGDGTPTYYWESIERATAQTTEP